MRDGRPKTLFSSLSTRTLSAVPPSSQSYEPLVKSVLAQRTRSRIIPFSFLFTWLSLVAWRVWLEPKGIWTIFYLVKPSWSIGAWVVGVFPLLVLRKSYLKAPVTHSTSPSTTIRNATTQRSKILTTALICYITSAVAFTFFHVISSPQTPNGGLRFFVKSKKHPFYLNGRVVFLFFSQIVHGVLFLLRNVLLGRSVIGWRPHNSQSELDLTSKLLALAIAVPIFGVFCTAVQLALFVMGRAVVLPILLKIPLVSHLLRPFAAHFLKGYTPVLFFTQFPTILRALALGITTLASWEVSETLFDNSVSEPISVISSSAEPFVTLISGISSGDAFYKHSAYLELADLAGDQSPGAITARTAFFADQKYNPSLWSHLCRNALLDLGRDYQLVLRRGKPAPIAPTPAPPPVSKPQPPSTPLLRKQIFKPRTSTPVKNVVNSLASSGDITLAVDEAVSEVPELFRSVSAAVTKPVEKVVAPIVPTVSEVKGLPALLKEKSVEIIKSNIPPALLNVCGGVHSWWTKDRLKDVVEGTVLRRETDAFVVRVLSYLACASLKEDRYGVVQRDLPKILEAFLSFLGALEDYRAEIVEGCPTHDDIAASSGKEQEDKLRTLQELSEAVEPLDRLQHALKNGVEEIVDTFGGSLSAFKFPPRVARKLQGYMDVRTSLD
ncbi:nucleoporin protein Ndc1-Nup [Thelephora terrestris]|uniref:Nucleoporin protein Ndc1-Nup n=1 Tax=Thelephora terrestris TaxID=56493 RepID=A0A9P6HJD2_9AGAM|nr:nucleoporin protein Ndc1-Nup [Thelephora terrestris]